MLAKSKNTKPCVIFREAKKKVSNDFGLAAKVISEMFPIADSYFYEGDDVALKSNGVKQLNRKMLQR